MDNLIPMIGALIVITAYCMGVWTGSLFLYRREGRTGGGSSGGRNFCDRGSGDRGSGKKRMRTVVAEVCGEDGTVDNAVNLAEKSESSGADGDMTEEEKRLIKEQQKALEQCMSYSVDMAYGNIKMDR